MIREMVNNIKCLKISSSDPSFSLGLLVIVVVVDGHHLKLPTISLFMHVPEIMFHIHGVTYSQSSKLHRDLCTEELRRN